MDKQNKKHKAFRIASYIGLGLLALETALLVGSCVVSCSNKGQEAQASDSVRVTSPVVKPFSASPRPEGFRNLLDDAQHFVGAYVHYSSESWENLVVESNEHYKIDLITLPAGRYYIGCENDNVVWASYASMTPTKAYDDLDLPLVLSTASEFASMGNFSYSNTLTGAKIGLEQLAGAVGQQYPAFLSVREPTAYLVQVLQSNSAFVYLIDESSDVSDVVYNLPSTYDFRRWVANVDPATGCLSLETRDGNGLGFRNFVFPFIWRAGDGKVYNYIYVNVVGLDSSQALIVNGNGEAKTAGNIFGDNWFKFSMLMTIRYGFDPSYSGEYIEKYNDTVSLNPLYYANVYRNTLVSGTLDGQGLSAFDCRAVMLPAMYRYFDVFQDRGVVFSTPNYSNVTTGELLNLDLSSVVVLGDISSSPMSMLTQGFNAIASILTIQVLPNVTIGLLMFIPLIVTIILVIVRLLQK